MRRLLVVDDEPGLRKALERGLTAEGFEVVTASDGRTALRAALTGSFDLILLDVIIPGLSGYRVLQHLRAEGITTPVLMLSAKDGEVDQADGLDLGADGYLVKPFSFVVLVAQLRALIRRHEAGADGRSRRLRLGSLTIDPAARRATWCRRPIDLTHREFSVLHALAGRPDTVLSKAELLRVAWGSEEAATHNAVEVYVGYLRRKLQTVGADQLLQTVRGRGYTLAGYAAPAATAPDGRASDGRASDRPASAMSLTA